VGIKNAKTEEELGFRQQSIMKRILTRRDYKPYALTTLIKAEIIRMTDDGRLYLSEEKLMSSGLYKSQSIYQHGNGLNPVCNPQIIFHQCISLPPKGRGQKITPLLFPKVENPFKPFFMPLDFDYRASF